MADYIINFSGNCCELFIILFFLKDNYKLRFSKAVSASLFILFTLLQFINTNLFLSESGLVLLGAFIFTFLVMIPFSINWRYRILFSLFICLLNGLSEFIVGMILSAVLGSGISKLQENVLLFAVCTLASKFLTYVAVLSTKIKKFKTDIQSLKQNITLIFSLPFATFLVMILFLSCCYQINSRSFHILTLTVSVILVLSNIAIYYIIDKQNELIETKEKLFFAELHIKNQILHYQELYKHQNELRIFRHDIKNRLLSLMALVREGESEKALQIMEKNLDMLDEMNSNIVNSGNPVVDAVLQSKLHAAKEKQISLKISTKLADEITIDESELGIVIGNALDNAIEAADKNIDKNKKHIDFSLMLTDDRISVSVSNPVEKDTDIRKLTTSKHDKNNHGYGIQSIRTIAQKYDGIVMLSCENKTFNISVNMANK